MKLLSSPDHLDYRKKVISFSQSGKDLTIGN